MAEVVTTRRIKGNSNVTMRSVYFGVGQEGENFATKKSVLTSAAAAAASNNSPTQKKFIQNIVR